MALLLIDVGRGTQDILLYQPGEPRENSIQLILPSPTVLLSRQVEEASLRGEEVLFTGETMGGGPLGKALRQHLGAGGKARATARSAATFDDDLDKVREMGVEIIGDEEAARLRRRGCRTVVTADVNIEAIETSLAAWGLAYTVGDAAVAVQDHGRAPEGMSDRTFRFEKFRELLQGSPSLRDLSYRGDELPGYLTRMDGVRRTLDGRGRLVLMDTGFAALLGSLADDDVGQAETQLLLNAGNGHTLAGVVRQERLTALFEHHTRLLDGPGLMKWLDGLVAGTIDGGDVFRDRGHGAWIDAGAEPPGWDGIDVFAATGPRRELAATLPRRPWMAAPFGQMMLTGNCGLLTAWEEKWGKYDY